MTLEVVYSTSAEEDLENIYDYVSVDLMNPETARKLILRIMDSIESLNTMPLRFPIYFDEPWRSQGIRFFPCANYLIFYRPNKDRVEVVRVIYKKRKISQQMEQS